jgi:hypothetical protein
MKFALALFAALAAAGISNHCFAADRAPGGQVSQNMLAEMGLGEMQVISDQEGQAVRGKAVWLVWLGIIPPFNADSYIIHQGIAATVHFPDFKGFYVPPVAF